MQRYTLKDCPALLCGAVAFSWLFYELSFEFVFGGIECLELLLPDCILLLVDCSSIGLLILEYLHYLLPFPEAGCIGSKECHEQAQFHGRGQRPTIS